MLKRTPWHEYRGFVSFESLFPLKDSLVIRHGHNFIVNHCSQYSCGKLATHL
jgi:hypothetical protein